MKKLITFVLCSAGFSKNVKSFLSKLPRAGLKKICFHIDVWIWARKKKLLFTLVYILTLKLLSHFIFLIKWVKMGPSINLLSVFSSCSKFSFSFRVSKKWNKETEFQNDLKICRHSLNNFIRPVWTVWNENYLHVGLAFRLQFGNGQFRTGITEEFRVLGQEIIAIEPPNRRVNLLPRQVTLHN